MDALSGADAKKRAAGDWPAAIYDVLRAAAVRQVAYVPDAGHARLIRLCAENPGMRLVPLTTEEEGIGLIAGAWLGGERGVLLMQSSGVGNCINAFTLVRHCRVPFLALVTMRGEWGEFNPWQVPMGQGTQAALELAGCVVYRVDEAAEAAPSVEAAARIAFDSGIAVGVLLSQRLIGSKQW